MGVGEPARCAVRAVVPLSVVLLVLGLPPARGQPQETPEVTPPGKTELLAALRSWGVPDDTWALLTPETAVRLVEEPPESPLLESPYLLGRMGCVVVSGELGTALVSDAPRFHTAPAIARMLSHYSDIARVCDGVSGELNPWLAAGAWVSVDALNDDAFEALSRLSGPDASDPDLDSPNVYFRVWVQIECELRAAGSEDVLRRTLVATAQGAGGSLPVVSLVGAPTGPRCCAGVREYRALRQRGPHPVPLGELPEAPMGPAPGDPFESATALRLFPGPDRADGLESGRATVWTLREWAEQATPLADGRPVRAARDAADMMLVIPVQCRSWLDTVEAVRSLGGLNFIDLQGMHVVSGASVGRILPPEVLTEMAGAWSRSMARLLLETQWPVRYGGVLSTSDRDALAGTGGFAPLTPAVAGVVWAAPRHSGGRTGASSARVRLTDNGDGSVSYDSGEVHDPPPESLEVRAVPQVVLGLACVRRYGETAATRLLRELLSTDGLDPGTEPLFALVAVRQLSTGAVRVAQEER